LLPLEKIRVISFGNGAVVPDCSKILGELGAQIIKIETRANPDFMRTIGPDPNAIAGFNESNRNKRSFAVKLNTGKGKEIVSELFKQSDIVVENFRGGVMKSFGLGYDYVRQLKPDIIYLSSPGFGGGGPYTNFKSYGPMLSATSGMLSIWAHPEDPHPVGSSAPLPDHMASKQLVIAALAALDYRRRTGKGQFIDMAQTEVAAGLIGESYLEYTINGRVPKPLGNRSPYSAPHNIYPCKGQDQWCAISVSDDSEWEKFCQAIGNPAWVKSPEFIDIPSRLRNVDELDRLIGEWTANLSNHEVEQILQEAGVAAGIVQRVTDLLEDPQIKSLGAIIELDHPVVGKRLYPGIPFKMSGAPPLKSTRAPLLGEHTEEICRELLNMSEEEIITLKEEGVLEGVDK